MRNEVIQMKNYWNESGRWFQRQGDARQNERHLICNDEHVAYGGNVTSAGWKVTLCDLIWHVSSRSSEASYELLYSVYLTSTLPYNSVHIEELRCIVKEWWYLYRDHYLKLRRLSLLRPTAEMRNKWRHSRVAAVTGSGFKGWSLADVGRRAEKLWDAGRGLMRCHGNNNSSSSSRSQVRWRVRVV